MSEERSLLTPMPLTSRPVSAREVDDDVFLPLESFPSGLWLGAFLVSVTFAGIFGVCTLITMIYGIGMWGNNMPVAWGLALVNFVFWVGIAHAGTLISSILLQFRQRWRMGIARFAEAVTVFAVFVAMMFPWLHTGRPWLAMFWLVPYPNNQALYQNFRSPLEWDVVAVFSYGAVSTLFWYTGLIPDLATARDRAQHPVRKLIYGLLSLGWTGSARAWVHYERAYTLFAGLATALVTTVSGVVAFDFAVSQMPGWHTSVFPPYFVAGAIFSGFATVCSLCIQLRRWFRLEHLITENHIQQMSKVVIATSMMVGYVYLMELFVAWYSGNIYERYVFLNRACGPYAMVYWTMFTCNVVLPQLLWFSKVRHTRILLVPILLLVNVGMWCERFVIVITTPHRDFMPANWDMFYPSLVEIGMLVGSFGLFFTMLLLFCRFLPVIATAEMKAVLPGAQPAHGEHHE